MQISPSINKVSFSCPHCGAHASQRWASLFVDWINHNKTPRLPNKTDLKEIDQDETLTKEVKNCLRAFVKNILSGLVFLESGRDTCYSQTVAGNLHLSECFACKKLSVWTYDRCLFPAALKVENPNPDLPEEIRLDYEEAGRILDLSPRGAAALLRLAIQKLCIHLGETGTIDKAIAGLVEKGLLPLVQQSLDAVRVIGNEAVHPGVMDLRDDRETAKNLFELVNIIAQQMISIPNHVNEIYKKLPENKLRAIAERDKTPKS